MTERRNTQLPRSRSAGSSSGESRAHRHLHRFRLHWDICSGSPPIRLENAERFFGVQLVVGLLCVLALLIIG